MHGKLAQPTRGECPVSMNFHMTFISTNGKNEKLFMVFNATNKVPKRGAEFFCTKKRYKCYLLYSNKIN